MLVVALVGLISNVPLTILWMALALETLYPTLGDEDCVTTSNHPGYTEHQHPGYMGPGLLDTPLAMAPDGLCLYHCLAATIDNAC